MPPALLRAVPPPAPLSLLSLAICWLSALKGLIGLPPADTLPLSARYTTANGDLWSTGTGTPAVLLLGTAAAPCRLAPGAGCGVEVTLSVASVSENKNRTLAAADRFVPMLSLLTGPGDDIPPTPAPAKLVDKLGTSAAARAGSMVTKPSTPRMLLVPPLAAAAAASSPVAGSKAHSSVASVSKGVPRVLCLPSGEFMSSCKQQAARVRQRSEAQVVYHQATLSSQLAPTPSHCTMLSINFILTSTVIITDSVPQAYDNWLGNVPCCCLRRQTSDPHQPFNRLRH